MCVRVFFGWRDAHPFYGCALDSRGRLEELGRVGGGCLDGAILQQRERVAGDVKLAVPVFDVLVGDYDFAIGRVVGTSDLDFVFDRTGAVEVPPV